MKHSSPKELIIYSDGTIANTKLIIDGEIQDVLNFSFSTDVDGIVPEFIIKPAFLSKHKRDEEDIEFIETLIKTSKLQKLAHVKNKHKDRK